MMKMKRNAERIPDNTGAFGHYHDVLEAPPMHPDDRAGLLAWVVAKMQRDNAMEKPVKGNNAMKRTLSRLG